MARRPRRDEPGSWHHVVNRAIAKRPYFESRSDQRSFLARLAREVRRGTLEVHAFCLMTTHFHLLLCSPVGDLSGAMRRVQNAYSRHFNRRRRRDGPLIRARYFSKRIETLRYRDAVVRYIDRNAVKARVVSEAALHEFGSARSFIGGDVPRWLSRRWIESRALEITGAAEFSGALHLRAFGSKDESAAEAMVEMVEARMASAGELDPLDDLIGQTAVQVRRWMESEAQLADGLALGLPVCGPACVARAVSRHVADEGDWLVRRGRSAWEASSVAHVGLLRDLAAAPLERIGRIMDISLWSVRRRVELHHSSILDDGLYRERVSRIAQEALAMVS